MNMEDVLKQLKEGSTFQKEANTKLAELDK